MRNTWKKMITLGLSLCLAVGLTVNVQAEEAGSDSTDEVLAEYTRLMEAEAGDALDAFLNGLTQSQKYRLMLALSEGADENTARSGQCGEALTWTLEEGTLTVSGAGEMPAYSLEAPAPWLPLRREVTALVVESGVTGLGDLAFAGLTELTTVQIPAEVTKIGSAAFFGCGKLTGILLPAGLKELGEYCFSGCKALTNLSVPDGVVEVPEGLFSGCSALQNVSLSVALKTIGEEAFRDCERLSNLQVPKSVEFIGVNACRGCTGLSAVTIPESVTVISDGAFAGCTGLHSITISDSTEEIGAEAFSGCTGVTSVVLPQSLKTIGASAFAQSGITWVVVHGNVPDIGEEAFAGCHALTSVTLEEGVKNLFDGAFRDCISLNTLTLPESVESIGKEAFAKTGLKKVTFLGNAPKIDAEAFEAENTELIYSCKDPNWAEVTAALKLNWKAEHPKDAVEAVEAKEATCDEPGTAAGTRCSVCGAMLTGETVAALGHDFADGVCTRCGMEEEIPIEEPVTADEEPAVSEEAVATEEVLPEETEATIAEAESAEADEAPTEETEPEDASEPESAASEEAEEAEKSETVEQEPVAAPKIYAETVSSHSGKKVNVAIVMENNPGVASVSLNIRWDAEALKLLEIEDTGLLGGAEHKPTFSNPYRLTWANDTLETNMTENGTLVILHFETAGDLPAGTYPIHVSYDEGNFDIYDCELNPVAFLAADGGVEVGSVLPGDINRDGKVNNIDRALLTRYLAGWEFPDETLDLEAADMNGDGKVNNMDRAVLARFLAGWEQYQ